MITGETETVKKLKTTNNHPGGLAFLLRDEFGRITTKLGLGRSATGFLLLEVVAAVTRGSSCLLLQIRLGEFRAVRGFVLLSEIEISISNDNSPVERLYIKEG